MFTLRIAAVSFAALVSIGAILQAAGLIPAMPKLETTVWILSLVIIGVDNAGTLVVRKINKDRSQMEKDIDSALMSFFAGISKSKYARFEELGGSVWVKRLWQPPKYWFTGEVLLRRVRRFRAMDYPHQSGIPWTSRMGVVGRCWSDRRRCYRSLWNLSTGLDDEARDRLTEPAFEKMSAEARAGFTYSEFKTVAGKYSEVVATPIFSHGAEPKLLGVLSIDRAMPDLDLGAQFTPILNTPRVREDLEVIVKLIARRLSKRE